MQGNAGALGRTAEIVSVVAILSGSIDIEQRTGERQPQYRE